MVNKVIKKKWLKALRSGEYEQAIGTLTQGDRFCCLGVLANELGGFDGFTSDGLGYLNGTHGQKYRGFLPPQFARDIGIPDEGLHLASMNDGGANFEEIADYIERSL